MKKNKDVTEKTLVKNDPENNIHGRFMFHSPKENEKMYGFTFLDFHYKINGLPLYLKCGSISYELVSKLFNILNIKKYFTFAETRVYIKNINVNKSKSNLDGINCESMLRLNVFILTDKIDTNYQKLYSLNPVLTLDELIQLALAYKVLKKHTSNHDDFTYIKPLTNPIPVTVTETIVNPKPVEVVETVLKPNKQLDLGLFDKRTIVNNNSSLINIALDHLTLLKENKARIENESKITDLNAKKDILSSTLEHTRKNLELAQSKNSLAEAEYNEFMISYNNHVDEYPDAYLAIIDIDSKIKEASRIISEFYK